MSWGRLVPALFLTVLIKTHRNIIILWQHVYRNKGNGRSFLPSCIFLLKHEVLTSPVQAGHGRIIGEEGLWGWFCEGISSPLFTVTQSQQSHWEGRSHWDYDNWIILPPRERTHWGDLLTHAEITGEVFSELLTGILRHTCCVESTACDALDDLIVKLHSSTSWLIQLINHYLSWKNPKYLIIQSSQL